MGRKDVGLEDAILGTVIWHEYFVGEVNKSKSIRLRTLCKGKLKLLCVVWLGDAVTHGG